MQIKQIYKEKQIKIANGQSLPKNSQQTKHEMTLHSWRWGLHS